MTGSPSTTSVVWQDVCAVADVPVDRGVCALVGGHQVAIFRVSPSGDCYAIGNQDPFSGANVLSRGIVGTIAGTPMVASPVYKHRFDLRTGVALEDDSVQVPRYEVRVVDARIEVAIP